MILPGVSPPSPARSFAMLGCVGLLIAGIPGCAQVTPRAPSLPTTSNFCARTGGQQNAFVTLAFGLSIPGGGTVTPRFPAGFTAIEAQGQWQNGPTAPIIREKSRLIWIIAPESPELASKLDAIRKAYKEQFNQNSVGAFIQSGCASF